MDWALVSLLLMVLALGWFGGIADVDVDVGGNCGDRMIVHYGPNRTVR